MLRFLLGRAVVLRSGARLQAPNIVRQMSRYVRQIQLFQKRASRSDEFHFKNPEQLAIGILLNLR